ncbi:MAG: NPCBM/NEW2 domain-containing protein [Clostridia bacterium]|nr:NPCBM/NEW2 domain-containing protein [Clostridia bacterium]
MKKEMKGFVTGVIVTALVFITVFTTFAEPIQKVVTAVYNNIKIYVDGNLIQPKDANGNKVDPFIYNGTTYLPVRAVSQALGKNIEWDDKTKSIYIGETQQSNNYMSDSIKPSEISESGKCEVNSKMQIDGVIYNKGYKMYTAKAQDCLVKFDLEGKYSDISGVLGLDDQAESAFVLVEIYADGKMIETYHFKDGINSAKVNWNVTGIKELAVKAYGVMNGDSKLDLAGFTLKSNPNFHSSTVQKEESQLTSDDVTVKMSAGVEMIGVLFAFPEGVTDVVVTDVSKSEGRFKPFPIKKYEYNFFTRAGTQDYHNSEGLAYFSTGEILELTVTYKYNGMQKTTVINQKILPPT